MEDFKPCLVAAARYTGMAAQALKEARSGPDFAKAQTLARSAMSMTDRAQSLLTMKHGGGDYGDYGSDEKYVDKLLELSVTGAFVSFTAEKEIRKILDKIEGPHDYTPINAAVSRLVDAEFAVKSGDIEKAKRITFESVLMAQEESRRTRDPKRLERVRHFLTEMVPAMTRAIQRVETGQEWITPEEQSGGGWTV